MQAKLFMAIMYSDPKVYEEVIGILKKEYGDIDFEDEEYDFDFTDYYLVEFGAKPKKRFVLFKKKIDSGDIVQIKLNTIETENQLKVEGKRMINIDPGYITDSEVVVPSTKPLPHRTYAGRGIVLDKQLGFENGKVITFRHTFADYRVHNEFFKRVLE